MSAIPPAEIIPVGNMLGECVLWEDRHGAIWWTDIEERRVFCYRVATQELHKCELPERLACFGFIENDTRLIAGFESGFGLYDLADESVSWIARIEDHMPHTRLNDGRVDRQGRFWVGSMVEKERLSHGQNEGQGEGNDTPPERGSLYSLCGRDVDRHLEGISISNSLCWSPDGKTLYFADSPTRRIMAHDIDTDTGKLGQARLFAQTEPGSVPDGATVDAEGYVWSAQWGGAQVVRYDPSGEVDFVLPVPVSNPTCVAFGGPNLNWLIVSTARSGLSPAQLEAEPAAGHILIYHVPWYGLPECRFRLGG